MKNEKALFLYGKLRYKNKAIFFCNLHKCYIDKQNLFSKKFKCEKCKHCKEVSEGS